LIRDRRIDSAKIAGTCTDMGGLAGQQLPAVARHRGSEILGRNETLDALGLSAQRPRDCGPSRLSLSELTDLNES